MLIATAVLTLGLLTDASGTATSPILPVTPAAHSWAGPDWTVALDRIKSDHFHSAQPDAVRQAGIRKIRAIQDPTAFQPMIECFHDARDDVREAMLHHFTEQGPEGQAALAWTAIHSRDPSLQYEASLRLQSPAGAEVLQVLDTSLRHANQAIVANAAKLVNLLDVTDAIPLLINTQIVLVEGNQTESFAGGGLISSGRKFAYVSGLIPVFGVGTVAYQPVVSTVNEGFAVAAGSGDRLVCRAEVHRALVLLSTRDSGMDTTSLGYDVARWHEWHRTTYLPLKEARRREALRQESIRKRADQLRQQTSPAPPSRP